MIAAALVAPTFAQSPQPAQPQSRRAAPTPLPPSGTGAASSTDLQALPVERNPPGAVRTEVDAMEEDYRIGSQDLLEIQIFGLQDMKRDVRVNARGMIGLPMIGNVKVAGLTQYEAEALIGGLYRKDLLQNPEVSVFIKEFTRQRFTMEGAVSRPGMYPLKGPTTLMMALALAGGGGSLANMSDVTLFRVEDGERRATKLDVEKIRTAEAPDPMIQADDLIVIGRSPGRVVLRDSIIGDIIGIFNPFSYLRP